MNPESKTPASDMNGHHTASKPSIATASNGALAGASREVHSFLTDIEDLIKATTSLTGDDLARAKAKLSERVTSAKASVEEMGGVIADRARNTAKATDGYVHEQPWQAIGIGAALGLVIGFALARRG